MIPGQYKAIEEEAFSNMRMDILMLPNGLEEIGTDAFRGCPHLEVIEIRHDPEVIGEDIANKSTRIRCYQGSKVDAYCQEYGYTVEYIEKQ